MSSEDLKMWNHLVVSNKCSNCGDYANYLYKTDDNILCSECFVAKMASPCQKCSEWVMDGKLHTCK